MVRKNPFIYLPGQVPQLGSHLTIKKNFCVGPLGSILAAHLVLYVVIAVWTRRVVRTDDSYVDMAQLLKEVHFSSNE